MQVDLLNFDFGLLDIYGSQIMSSADYRRRPGAGLILLGQSEEIHSLSSSLLSSNDKSL